MTKVLAIGTEFSQFNKKKSHPYFQHSLFPIGQEDLKLAILSEHYTLNNIYQIPEALIFLLKLWNYPCATWKHNLWGFYCQKGWVFLRKCKGVHISWCEFGQPFSHNLINFYPDQRRYRYTLHILKLILCFTCHGNLFQCTLLQIFIEFLKC